MITISPVGLAGTALVANQLSMLATIKEKLCRAICVNSSVMPQVAVTYTSGTPTLNDATVFVPITATVTVVTPGCGCKATTQLFTESFEVAFQGQTAVPASVTITNEGRSMALTNVGCGKAHSYTIYDSLTVAIA